MNIPNDEKKIKLFEEILLVLVIILVAVGSFGLGRLSILKSSSYKDLATGTDDIVIQPPQALVPKASAAKSVAPVTTPAPSSTAISSTTSSPASTETASVPSSAAGAYVASKSGTKYYPVGCGSANRIKDENKVYFNTPAEAESAGYEKSATCGN